jgi:hypothetical protein
VVVAPAKLNLSRTGPAMNSGRFSQRINSRAVPARDDPFERTGSVVSPHRAGGGGGKRFASVLVGHGQDLDRPGIGDLVAHEVDRRDLSRSAL